MTEDSAPLPSNPLLSPQLVSRAAQQLAALADPERAVLLGAVLRLAVDQPCSLPELAADQECDLRTLTRRTASLAAAGLVTVREHRIAADVAALAATAEALVTALPVSVLLVEEPDLGRLFRYGRLVKLPLLNRVEERERLAALLVRLLPLDVSLTEAEVNAALAEVSDDVAALRRFLVDAGVLTRRAGHDYHRV